MRIPYSVCQLGLALYNYNYWPIKFQRFCGARTSLPVSCLVRCHFEFSPILAGQLSPSKIFCPGNPHPFIFCTIKLYCVLVASSPILAGQLSPSKIPPTHPTGVYISQNIPMAQYNLHTVLQVDSFTITWHASLGYYDNVCTVPYLDFTLPYLYRTLTVL